MLREKGLLVLLESVVSRLVEVVFELIEDKVEEKEIELSKLQKELGELLRVVLDCLSVLEKTARVKKELFGKHYDEWEERIAVLAYEFFNLDEEGRKRVFEVYEKEKKRMKSERKSIFA